jgi:hypothetical protein
MYIRLATKADATDQLKRFFTLTILLLGFAVFFWGLHDKLSLYAPPSAPPPMARAKLLSQAEQPSTRADAALPRSPESVPPLFVVLFTALLSLLFSVENDVPHAPRRDFRPKSPPLLPATRLRPPPAADAVVCAA